MVAGTVVTKAIFKISNFGGTLLFLKLEGSPSPLTKPQICVFWSYFINAVFINIYEHDFMTT